jgi:NADH-quinone oxidoreductase subunit L
MTVPLVVLAVASVVGGFIGIEQFVGKEFHLEEIPLAPIAVCSGLAAVLIGFLLAKSLYAKAQTDPLPAKLNGLAVVLRNKFYFDELYARLIAMTQDALAWVVDFLDRWIIGGLMVRGTQGTTELVGRALRFVQTGNLQAYSFLFATGVAVLLYLVFYR